MTPGAHRPEAEPLPGIDPAWSRVVKVFDEPSGRRVGWHLLDTGPLLEAAGERPVGTILAVHGNPTWAYLWRHVLRASLDGPVGRRWRVIAVDQLEMGRSARTGVERRLAQRVRDLGALTDALGLAGPIVTLGHDWGGIVSLGWAVGHPDLLAASVVLNTALHQPLDAPLPAALRLALGLHRVGTVDTTAFLDVTLGIAHPALPRDVRAAYRSPYRIAARRRGIGVFVRDIPATARHPSRAEFERIGAAVADLRVPVLLLWGPRDPVFGERFLDDLLERVPHADVHRFEGAGHLLAEDADVAGALLTWLDVGRIGAERPSGVENAAAGPESRAEPGFRPLWAALDERAGDSGTALLELAPRGGRSPLRVSWRALARRTRQLAAGLAAAGVRPGDRVSLLVPPGADLSAAFNACLRIGAVVVVADAGLGVRGLSRAVRGARPRWIIGVPVALAAARALGWPGERIAAGPLSAVARAALGVQHSLSSLVRSGEGVPLPPEPAPDDHAAVLFTSGSTGPAKGVRYTHRQLSGVRDALRPVFGVGEAGLVAGFGPFALFGPAWGCPTAVPDMDVAHPATLTARAVADAVLAVDAESAFLSPAALRNVLDTADALDEPQRGALARVRTLLSAGAPLGLPLLTRAEGLFPAASVHSPYGMTEALLVADVTLEQIRAAAAEQGVPVGLPATGARVRIAPLDDDGRPTGAPTTEPGRTGEVLGSAPHVFHGYDRLWRTDAIARADADGERWHRTGDVGHLGADGLLWIEGRLPHVVVTANGVITPVGVEQAAERVPGVRRAAAVGVGPRGTQQLVVVAEADPAVRRPRVAPLPLADAVRAEVGRAVAAVLLVPRLPTDVRHNSKIERTRVAAWAEGVLAGGRVTPP